MVRLAAKLYPESLTIRAAVALLQRDAYTLYETELLASTISPVEAVAEFVRITATIRELSKG